MEDKMTNCPACGKPVLNEGQFTSFLQFNLKCPWCQTMLKVTVQPKVTALIVRPEKVETTETKIYARLPYRD
jgi:phage FluMu protein Com